MAASLLSRSDHGQLKRRGISIEEAERQLELLRRPPRYVELVRPCTVGDGIQRITEKEARALQAQNAESAAAGRFHRFVPASGAATRMFKELLHFQLGPGRELTWEAVAERARAGEPEARALVTFLDELQRFPFHADLAAELARRGERLDRLASAGAFGPILDALLDEAGMDYDDLPKALLKFHAYDTGSRTPLEEHMVEAAETVKDQSGRCRLHFTVSAEHRAGFESLLREVKPRYERRCRARFEVLCSLQKPSTDTLAIDGRDRPLRDDRGRLIFRPGGHGALIGNLLDMEADIVFVKNIDNVQPDRLRGPVLHWKRVLGGYLVDLERRIFDYLNSLAQRDPPEELLEEALTFVRRRLCVELDERRQPTTYQCKRAFLIDRLNRPLRVCGVVPNTGEPGGGPCWVRRREGAASLQIAESAQVNLEDPNQRGIFAGATHFNPVDLVCAVRDASGRPFELDRFVDHDAVIVTKKSAGGVELKVLERPGLWNGAMAEWNTVFVEVPIETFTPVKSVLDLLREEHQPA